MKKPTLLTIIAMLMLAMSSIASTVTLKDYTENLLSIKKNELARLQKGETGVNGYALFGSTPPAYLLTGDDMKDQIISSSSRIKVLNNEITYLQLVLNQSPKSSNGAPIVSDDNKQEFSDSDTSLPFFEDFNSGLGNWQIKDKNAVLIDGKLYWNTGQFQYAFLNMQIPMENIIIEFDGYCETNGINVYLQNEKEEGYIVIFGGWSNKQSASDIGKNSQNRQTVAGKVWEPKQWHHYKVEINGDTLRAYCDNRKIIDRKISIRFPTKGYLKLDSWNARIGIDNIRIYKINGSNTNSDISGLWQNGMPQIDYGNVSKNGDLTITTRHTWDKNRPLAYVSLLIEDNAKTKLFYGVYNTVNSTGGHVPSNHFGIYASGKDNLSKQDCKDAGKNGDVRLSKTLYSSLLPGTITDYNADSCTMTWKMRFHDIPSGKNTVRIRQVYMDETGGWQQIGAFQVPSK